MQEHPEKLQQFGNFMAGYQAGRPSWMDLDFFPVEENLVKGLSTDDDAVLLVDVGEGMGQDLEEFHRKLPHVRGQLILQDTPETIERTANLDKSIEPIGHDFFTPQPIRGNVRESIKAQREIFDILLTGARAYYMHSVSGLL